jgi:hypothetical protein
MPPRTGKSLSMSYGSRKEAVAARIGRQTRPEVVAAQEAAGKYGGRSVILWGFVVGMEERSPKACP